MRCALTTTSVDVVMAEADIPAHNPSSKSVKLAPSAFELWAYANGYDTAPAVLPAADRLYADRLTQEIYDAWNAGSANTARMLTDSMLETEALRERIQALAIGAGG